MGYVRISKGFIGFRDVTPKMENQMATNMENEIGMIWGRDWGLKVDTRVVYMG